MKEYNNNIIDPKSFQEQLKAAIYSLTSSISIYDNSNSIFKNDLSTTKNIIENFNLLFNALLAIKLTFFSATERIFFQLQVLQKLI